MELNKIQSNGSWGKAADDLNQNFSKVDKAVEQVKNATTRNKGYFSTDAALKSAFNRASLGDIAYVGSTYPYQIWAWNGTEWENTHENGGQESVNIGDYYTKEDTDKKLSELGSEVESISNDLEYNTSNNDELVLKPKIKDGIIINSDKFLINYNYLLRYVPTKQGDVIRVNVNGPSAATGYSIDEPMLNADVIDEITHPTSTAANKTEFISPIDGYFCISVKNESICEIFKENNGLNHRLTKSISNIEGIINGLDLQVEFNTKTIEGNLIVPNLGKGLIVQSDAILENPKFQSCYFPIKKGENIKVTLESEYKSGSFYIGFCENLPQNGEPIIGGYKSSVLSGILNTINSGDYYAPKDGYFVLSARLENTPVLKFERGNRIGYDVIDSATFSELMTIGSSFATEINSVLEIGRINVQNNKGQMMIQTLRNDKADNYIIVITDEQNIVIDLLRDRHNYSVGNKTINLSVYNGQAYYVYFKRAKEHGESIITWVRNGIRDEITTLQNVASDKAIAIIHFDGAENSTDGLFQSRKNFLKGYGIDKCSFCIGYNIFNPDKTDWVSDAVKEEYWQMIKEGYDFAWYPNLRCDEYDESGWDAYMVKLQNDLAKLGIYNITTWACGNMSLNQALANSLKKHNFKIARAGGSEESEVFPYTSENSFLPTNPISDKFIINASLYVGGNSSLSIAKDRIEDAIRVKKAFSIFTHQIEDNSSSNTNLDTSSAVELFEFIKSYIDSGKLEVMTWREYYAAVNIRDGYENDYNRLLKMSGI